MDRYSERVQTLKTMLSTETEFGKVFAYFFDNLGNSREFFDAGKQSKNPNLKMIIEGATGEVFGKDVKVTNITFIRMAKDKFYHGSFFVNGRMATVLYFEELEMGMIAISMGFPAGQMSYIRFTAAKIDPDKAAHFAGNVSKRMQ